MRIRKIVEDNASEAIEMLEEFKKTQLAKEMNFGVKKVEPLKDGRAKVTFDYDYFYVDEYGDIGEKAVKNATGVIEPAKSMDKFLEILFDEILEDHPEKFPGFMYIEEMFGDKRFSVLEDEDNLLYWALRQNGNLDIDDVDYEEDYYAVILSTNLEAWSKKHRNKILRFVRDFLAKNY